MKEKKRNEREKMGMYKYKGRWDITSVPLPCLTLNGTCVSIRMMAASGQKRTRRGDVIRVSDRNARIALIEKTKKHG